MMDCEHTKAITEVEDDLAEMERAGVLDARTERQGDREIEALRVECEEAGCYQ